MNRPIRITPGLDILSPNDIRTNHSDLDVRKPDDIVAHLSLADSPSVLLISNSTWREAYLDGLSAGDWVCTVNVGYDDIPTDSLSEAGVAFTNCPGISAEQVAEHVFATAFSFTRQLWTYRDQQQAHDWRPHRQTMTDLAGDVCCILGLGGIGEAVAERASAFGRTVRGVKRTVEGYDGSADTVYQQDELLDGLSDARLLVIAVPLNAETRGMVDRDELNALADDAIVVNVARGPILVTEALLSALRNDTLHAACLDVTDCEPLPEGHPLWNRDDVLITPHCAGVSEKYPGRFLALFREQYERWCADEELHHRIV